MNAIHGSSNKEHASKTIAMVFGEVEFNEDGTIKGTLIEYKRKSKEPLHIHTQHCNKKLFLLPLSLYFVESADDKEGDDPPLHEAGDS